MYWDRIGRGWYQLALLMLMLRGDAAPAGEVATPAVPIVQQRGVPAVESNVVVLEVFVRGESDLSKQAVAHVAKLDEADAGLKVVTYDVTQDEQALGQFWKLAKHFQIEKPGLPAFYCCNRFMVGFTDAETTGPKIDELRTIHAFVREGCPHCRDAKAFLAGLQRRWPGVKVRHYDVINDQRSRNWMEQLSTHFKQQATSLPCLYLCGRFMVGYDRDETTGRQIEDVLRQANRTLPADSKAGGQTQTSSVDRPVKTYRGVIAPMSRLPLAAAWLTLPAAQPVDSNEAAPAAPGKSSASPPLQKSDAGSDRLDRELPPPPPGRVSENADLPPPPPGRLPDSADLPPPPPDDLPTATEAPPPPLSQKTPDKTDDHSGRFLDLPTEAPPREEIDVPLFGTLRVKSLGLPTFTFLVGLVDGFNPCAMWVLIFLLSVLVNVQDRWKMFVIAGTFVFVSGLAYFAFMAAWLETFQLIGLQRNVQIALGGLATFIGVVNVKDFFAFKKGLTFSIPESAKPGIAARVRKIVMAKYLTVALSGAVVLAVVVNVVELLCTAGLPALYTQILTLQQLPRWENYAYLLLYNVAYMLDDSIMLLIAVVTLSHRRLNEKEGRWLKLISGLVILALGLTMLFMPQWLEW